MMAATSFVVSSSIFRRRNSTQCHSHDGKVLSNAQRAQDAYGVLYAPGMSGPSWCLKLEPRSGRTPAVFPWNPPQNPMTSLLPVYALARRSADSTASAPLLYSCVRVRSPGVISAMSLTSAARCSEVKLPTWMRAICRWTAATYFGCAYPRLATPTPARRSMYRRPSTSYSRAPSPRSMHSRLKRATLCVPGARYWASDSKSASDRGPAALGGGAAAAGDVGVGGVADRGEGRGSASAVGRCVTSDVSETAG